MAPRIASPAAYARGNREEWRRRVPVGEYDGRELYPAEVLLLVRHREHFSRRVLEIGCGPGRLLGYLVQLSDDVHAIDISPTMVQEARRRYPAAHVRVGDMLELDPETTGERFDLILLAYNLIDVVDLETRRTVLEQLRGLLAPGGLLVFSSHNLAALRSPGTTANEPAGARRGRAVAKLLATPPSALPTLIARLPRRARNRRRLAPLQYRTPDHALVNERLHDYAMLHLYIGRDAQERELRELGYEPVECLELSGDPVPAGQPGEGPWLHYVARAAGEA